MEGSGSTAVMGKHVDEAVAGSGDELATRLRLAVGRLSRRVRIDGGESIPPLQLSTLTKGKHTVRLIAQRLDGCLSRTVTFTVA